MPRIPGRPFRTLHYPALALVLGLGFTSLSFGGEPVRYVQGELLVKFRPVVPKHVVEDIHRGAGARLLTTFRGDPRLQHVRVPRGWPLESAIAYYETRADVEYVERNLIYRVRDTVPNDARFSDQWNWQNISGIDVAAPTAWDKARGRFTVVVGSLDTGIEYTHPDLALNIWTNPAEAGAKCTNGIDDGANGYVDDCRGWNFVNGTNNPVDDYFHGTHTAGIIGARGNNLIGVTGANWDVQIMPVKVFDSTGTGTLANIITGIDYALANGVQVLNASWGLEIDSQALYGAIERASQQGVLFVASAGNSGQDLDTSSSSFYPCANTNANVVCVAAMDSGGNLSSYSNYGAATVDLGAPGDDVLSTVLNQGYAFESGTSMAAPHVTGAVALIKGCKPSLSAATIKSVLISTAQFYPSVNGKTVANGMVNYGAAVNHASVAGAGTCDPEPSNIAPVANTGGPYNSNLKKTIQFNGTPSNDPDGQILIYFWDFGDGTTALGPRPTHQYTSPGVYSVSLTVRDNLGAMDTATSTVTIRPINRSSGPTH